MVITKEMIESWLGKEIQNFQVIPERNGKVFSIKVQPKASLQEISITIKPTKASQPTELEK